MRIDDPNLPQLRLIAEALGDLREHMVFVGGAVAGLLVTDPLADPVRATRDVDAVVNADRAMFHRMGAGITLRLVGAVAFVATKLEAFAGRGGGDYLGSHDIEDILNIVDGREELADELAAAPVEVRQSGGEAFDRLLTDRNFANVLPGMPAEPNRAEQVLQRLSAMCHR